MRRAMLILAGTLAVLCAAVLVRGALAGTAADGDADRSTTTRLTANGSGIVERLPSADFDRGELKRLPRYQPNGQPFQVDLRGYDLRSLDLTGRTPDLVRADFDSKTKWPKSVPADFDWRTIMELGRNPGLGLRALHAKGITGKGIGIGIIDQGLLADHVEYRDRLKLYEEIHCGDREAAMHGPAVASIAVGKTVGVAPGADLYYIAETHVDDAWLQKPKGDMWDHVDFTWTAKSIDRLLEISRALPKERRIRVISISVGWSPGQAGYDAVQQAVARATQQGVFVISTALQTTHGLSFHALGRDPRKDPDVLASYGASSWDRYFLDEHPNGKAPLVVPMDSRTTASPTGARDYVHYAEGGWSWCVPYLAGLYALACQVKPDLTPDAFWAKATETGDVLTVTPPPPTPSSVEAATARVDKGLAVAKAGLKPGQSLEQLLGEAYSRMSGEKKDTMSEADFRTWAITYFASGGDSAHRPGPHQLGKIVNPARLIDALK